MWDPNIRCSNLQFISEDKHHHGRLGNTNERKPLAKDCTFQQPPTFLPTIQLLIPNNGVINEAQTQTNTNQGLLGQKWVVNTLTRSAYMSGLTLRTQLTGVEL